MTTGNTGHQAPMTGAGTSPPAPGTGGVPPAGASTLLTVAGALMGYTDSAGVTHKPKDTADAAVSEAILIQWQAHNTIDPATVAKPAVATPGAMSVATASFPQWADQIELSRRTWAAGGELNSLPKSMLTVLDGAEAARWAWILLQFGAEDDVNAYCNWFVAKVRAQGADKLYQMQQFCCNPPGASPWACGRGTHLAR